MIPWFEISFGVSVVLATALVLMVYVGRDLYRSVNQRLLLVQNLLDINLKYMEVVSAELDSLHAKKSCGGCKSTPREGSPARSCCKE